MNRTVKNDPFFVKKVEQRYLRLNYFYTFLSLIDLHVPARVHTNYSVHPLVRSQDSGKTESEQQELAY